MKRSPLLLLLVGSVVGCPDTETAPPAGTPRVEALVFFDDVPARHPDTDDIVYYGVVREEPYDPDSGFTSVDFVLADDATVSGVEVRLSGNAWPSEMQVWACPEKIPFDDEEGVFGPECDAQDRVRVPRVGSGVVTGAEALDRGFYYEDRVIEPGGVEGTADWRLVLYLPAALRIAPGGPPARASLEIRNVSLNDDFTGGQASRSFLLSFH